MNEHVPSTPSKRGPDELTSAPGGVAAPRISVVIPAYNNAQYLPQALHSVFAQDVSDFEVIVVDDGSTDGTVEALRPFAAQIRYVWQENAGSAAARNAGLALARGRYVVFLDGDDVLLPGKFREQGAMLDERPSLGMAHSGWQEIDAQGRLLQTVTPWEAAPTLDLDDWVWWKPVRLGAMMFRRQWLAQVDGFDAALRQSQDVDLMLRLALAGCTAAWLHRPTMAYRRHAASTIRRHAPQKLAYVTRVMDKLFADSRLPAHLQREERKIRFYYLCWLAWHLFETNHLPAVEEALRAARRWSPFAEVETALAWAIWFGRYARQAKRPLRDVYPLFDAFGAAAGVAAAARGPLARMMRWWLETDGDLADEDVPRLAGGWPFWREAALPQERPLRTPAEAMLGWWLFLWQPAWRPDSSAGGPDWRRASYGEGHNWLALSQRCLVYRPDWVEPPALRHFCDEAQRRGLWPAAAGVALFLTAFGQAALRGQRPRARAFLRLAAVETVKRPLALVYWLGFVKTAVRYRLTGASSGEYDD